MKYSYILRYFCLIQAEYFYNVKEQGYIGTVNKEIFPSIVSESSNALDFIFKVVDSNKHEFVIQKVNERKVFDIYGGLKKNSVDDQRMNLYTIHNGTNQRFKIINAETKEVVSKDKIYSDTEYNIIIGNKCLYAKHNDKYIYLGNCDDNKLESVFMITKEHPSTITTTKIQEKPVISELNRNIPKKIEPKEDNNINLSQNRYNIQNSSIEESDPMNRNISITDPINRNISITDPINRNISITDPINRNIIKPEKISDSGESSNSNYKKVNIKSVPDIELSKQHPDKIIVPTTEVHNITYTEIKDVISVDKIVEPTKTKKAIVQKVIEQPVQPVVQTRIAEKSPPVFENINSPAYIKNTEKEVYMNTNDSEPEYEIPKRTKTIPKRRRSVNKEPEDYDYVKRSRNQKVDSENIDYKKNKDRKKNAEYYKIKYNIRDEDIEYFKKNHKNITPEDAKKYVDNNLKHLSSEKRTALKKKIHDYPSYKAKLVTEKPVNVKLLKNKLNHDESETETDDFEDLKDHKMKKTIKKIEKKALDSKYDKSKSKNDFFD